MWAWKRTPGFLPKMDLLIGILVFLDLKNRRKKLLFNIKNKQKYEKLGKLSA